MVAAGALGALYALALWVRIRRGYQWSTLRGTSFVLGVVTIVIALSLDDRWFSRHVVVHLLLGMVAPVLLVLGAPGTLIIQAIPRHRRAPVLRVLHSGVARVVTHPLSGWISLVVTPWVLWFSDLYRATLEHPWLHELVHAHFLLSGYVFAAGVIGRSRCPRASARR